MSDIQRIKDTIDIVDFINEYVRLKPAGVNHKGCCPFHNEKTPSFMVNRDRQSWYCFGCSKGGDIFTFVQEIEGMEFIEALKFLANKAGIELTLKRGDVDTSQKNRLKDILREASRFYHHFLLKMDVSQGAREYLVRRGLTEKTIEQWQIGFISDQWDLLTKYLLKKGYGIDDLVASGLTIKRDNANPKNYKGYYDRFRGRIMFPIYDLHGYIVGFTGRVLVETEHSGGKYVNTPQTLLYDKSNVLFGLDKAKKVMKQNNMAVVVEGQMDVIACHQAGMTSVVASSGTALTEQQVALIKRYTNTIAMAFDADEAGQRAAKRGIDIAIEQGVNVRVIRIPEGKGKDPDECIQKNKEVWFTAVEQAQDIMQWYVDRAFHGKNLHDPKHKQHIANELLPEIARIPFAIEQDHWLQTLGSLLQVDIAVLREDLKRVVPNAPVQEHRVASSERISSTVVQSPTREELLQERLYMLVLKYPTMPLKEAFLGLAPALQSGRYAPLYEQLKIQYTTAVSVDTESLQDHEGYAIQILLLKADEEFSNISLKQAHQEASQLIASIDNEWKKTKRIGLERAIASAQQKGDAQRVASLLQEFQQL